MGKPAEPNSLKTCCVPQCKSRQTGDISLFLFPKDEGLKKRWVDALKTDKRITPQMQICSRHFTKSDYIISGTSKKLKKAAVPTVNLPWQFPNKRVSPTLAKARMERLQNRSQQKTPDTKKQENKEKASAESTSDTENGDEESVVSERDPFDKLLEKDDDTGNNKNQMSAKKEKNTPQKEKTEPEKKVAAVPGRAPTRLRQREGVLKCELCGRKCLTPQALRTHQQIAHKNIKNSLSDAESEPLAMIKASNPAKPSPTYIAVKKREVLMEPKTLKNLNSSETPHKMGSLVEQVLRNDDSDTTDLESDDSGARNGKSKQFKPQRRDMRKTEFECPKCKKRFAVMFSARKHIEKHHMGAQKGEQHRDLPPELRPVHIELCSICNATLTSNIHLCTGPLKLALGFICTVCNQEYKTLSLFDLHKSGMHSDGVESMFFPTLDEFENWKDQMENQTRASYTVLDQNDTKKIHRCTHVVHVGSGSSSRTRMCPSSIIVQEFTKGFQVHYYPIHHGHDHTAYNLSKAFSKYSIASLMNITASQLPDDSDEDDSRETDLYVQFRKLTEYLVNDAARINVRGLKLLMRKALEMISIINNYNEDEDILTLSDADDDLKEQVKTALSSYKQPKLKRPSSTAIETPVVKRTKPVFQSTENTLKEKAKVVRANPVVVNMQMGNENIKEQKTVSGPNNQSPTFIDSFQEFVGKERIQIKRRRKNDPAEPQSEKKLIVKTKMGQFKPSPKKTLSPTVDSISPSRNSISSVKDVEYEVKEQENDCNILILKI